MDNYLGGKNHNKKGLPMRKTIKTSINSSIFLYYYFEIIYELN